MAIERDSENDSNGSTPAQPTINIQSRSHEKLLDVIDELRSQGISRFIDLPQLIVCGDQSSGKSSVLEAVSGLRFPTKTALCTRFATELILRRGPEVTSSTSIVPDVNCPDDQKEKLQKFTSNASVYDDFGTIIEDATTAMGIDGSSQNFSSHVLRIELTGPTQPHLTLVDLPGLFHAGSKSQSDDDAKAVTDLVTNYMKKIRSIILAVVSAKNDYNNQIVTKYAREFDKLGSRTLGIITKPDTLHAGSEAEAQFVELAENNDVQFRLGWHVLKNRDYDQRDSSSEERDRSERDFFGRGIWASLSTTQLGIGSLKPRLSQVLQNQILRELPGLIRDVEHGIKDCETRISRLGVSRSTLLEQRAYLHDIGQNFTSIMREAIEADYKAAFFGDAFSKDDYSKRVRAVVQNLIDDFSLSVRVRGHMYEVVKDDSLPFHPYDEDGKDAEDLPTPPIKKEMSIRLAEVKELIRLNRGQELSAFPKEATVTALFREQCQPWVELIRRSGAAIFAAVREAVLLIVAFVAHDASTEEGILAQIINPALERCRTSFEAAIDRALHQHVKGHPITFNHYLTDNIQKLRTEYQTRRMTMMLEKYLDISLEEGVSTTKTLDIPLEFPHLNVCGLLTALTTPDETDMTTFSCSEALHIMEAYYKVAYKKFVDDFAVQCVEQALLDKLKDIFHPRITYELDEELIQDIAGETAESRVERVASTGKLVNLQQALEVLKRLDRGRAYS